MYDIIFGEKPQKSLFFVSNVKILAISTFSLGTFYRIGKIKEYSQWPNSPTAFSYLSEFACEVDAKQMVVNITTTNFIAVHVAIRF